jgi:hypothetical protein
MRGLAGELCANLPDGFRNGTAEQKFQLRRIDALGEKKNEQGTCEYLD